jgi:hypothetical protein
VPGTPSDQQLLQQLQAALADPTKRQAILNALGSGAGAGGSMGALGSAGTAMSKQTTPMGAAGAGVGSALG